MVEQREHPRSSSGTVVEMSHPSLGVMEAKAGDLSDGGIFVYTGIHTPPPQGTVLKVKIKRFTGVINTDPVSMRVVHVQSNGIGLSFV